MKQVFKPLGKRVLRVESCFTEVRNLPKQQTSTAIGNPNVLIAKTQSQFRLFQTLFQKVFKVQSACFGQLWCVSNCKNSSKQFWYQFRLKTTFWFFFFFLTNKSTFIEHYWTLCNLKACMRDAQSCFRWNRASMSIPQYRSPKNLFPTPNLEPL